MAKIILLVALAFSITTGSITMLVLNLSPRWRALATTGARHPRLSMERKLRSPGSPRTTGLPFAP